MPLASWLNSYPELSSSRSVWAFQVLCKLICVYGIATDIKAQYSTSLHIDFNIYGGFLVYKDCKVFELYFLSIKLYTILILITEDLKHEKLNHTHSVTRTRKFYRMLFNQRCWEDNQRIILSAFASGIIWQCSHWYFN